MLQVPAAEGKVDMGECVVGRPRDLRTLHLETSKGLPTTYKGGLGVISSLVLSTVGNRLCFSRREEPERNQIRTHLQ